MTDPTTTTTTEHALARALLTLQAEVERLRAHRELCTENLLKGYETGKAEERAAVVAWLRERQPGWPAGSGGHADAIENGEHRPEEKKP